MSSYIKLSKLISSLVLPVFISSLFISNVCANEPNPYARDLTKLSEFFEGEFDNDSQIWFEQDYRWKGDASQKHKRNHAIHERVELPAFGEHVFYVKEYLDNDPSNYWRRRLISLDADSPRGLRMKIYFLAKEIADDTEQAVAQLAKLQLSELLNMPGCDVWFKRAGDHFEGQMDVKACVFGEGDKRRYSIHNLLISENKYWRDDFTRLISNDQHFSGDSSGEPMKMRRATYYSCDLSMPYESYAKPHPKDVSLKGLLVHNQGGEALFTNPRTGKDFQLQLREKEYPYYKDGSDFFLLRLKEVTAKTSTALVTTGPNPGKVSVNVGKLSAFCQRVKD